MPRWFNTAGPNNPEWHYTVPAARRLPKARTLMEQGRYFVVRAARPIGKTTTLRGLAKELTAEGRHAALYFTCEEASVAGDNHGAAMRAILHAMRSAAERERS